MKVKKLAIATAAAVAIGAGGLGLAQAFGGGKGMGGHGLTSSWMAERLELTATQRDQIDDLVHESRKGVRDHVDGMMEARRKLRDLRRSGVFDEAAVRAAAKEQALHMEELIVARARSGAEVRGLLTADQQVKLEEMGERRRHKRGHRHF
jgi:Spy/CpxP family protein refolding chaperone